jgi:hypothetical protein
MKHRAPVGALLLVGVGVVLGATVLRTDIAQATGLATGPNVTVVNTPAQAVPGREQNTDGGGNIKVHEQGTADVNVTNTSVPTHEQGTADVHVTNSSLSIAGPAPVVDGGSNGVSTFPGQSVTNTGIQTATSVSIALSPGVAAIVFRYQGNAVSAFPGPFLSGGSASINLAFTRPIKFDSVTCAASSPTETCIVGWTGAMP